MRNHKLSEGILYSPYLLIGGGKVLDAGYALADLTGYRKTDFLDKDVADVINGILKCGISQQELLKPEDDCGPYYIFTRDGEARQVHMNVEAINDLETVVSFCEIPESRLEDAFPFVYRICCEDKYPMAVYNINCGTIVKSSRIFCSVASALCKDSKQREVRTIGDFVGLHDECETMSNFQDTLVGESSCLLKKVSSAHLKEEYDILYLPLQERALHRYSAIILFEKDLAATDVTDSSNQKGEKLVDGLQDADAVSFIMHELKTPINVVISAVQAMESICGKEMSPRIYSYITRIKNNVNRQLRLINSLLDISKAESGYMRVHMKNVDIVKLTCAIVESVRLYAQEKEIRVKFNTLLREKYIAIDAEKYERIMLNLLSNAIKHTPSGSMIQVNMSKVRDRICVEVKDEGIGIPENERELIFKRFWQSDNSMARDGQGTGIGLSLVKNLVAVLGGEITVNGEEGKGSSFKVYFIDRLVDGGKESAWADKEDIDDRRLERQVSIEFSNICTEEKKEV